MPSAAMLRIADAVIDSVQNNELTDDIIQKLYSVFPESVVLGALDLIDRENVIKYTTPYSYPQYEVMGSKETHQVFLDMEVSPLPFYCSCPAFAYAVLSSGSHMMCKHILASRLANKLSLFIERPMLPEELESMMLRQYGYVESTAG
ncbi:Zinc finger SWIM domain-containing protein 7 [Hypsizygus marmoreus]|uniref:Zinc finger SWIM domain-containing protein 7 n=1 Tax=Hypsizygus marmoreus TaxID=39966 RepID=A0A369K090_HYPMA|nr:Zinc finger SWIM domain-containing protein 7 [Hypsizygus marmoreus]